MRRSLGPTLWANRQQRDFFDSTEPEVLYSGAFGAGKSRIGCEKAYWLAQRYPGIPIGIFRKYAVNLAASTERTLLHDVIPAEAIARSNRSEHWLELANGSRIWMLGLDPDPGTGVPSKIGSVELGWAFIDEAVEVTEADWTMVKGRLRWPGIPFLQIAAATNPGTPTHWLIRRFEPKREGRLLLHASTFDNRLSPEMYRAEMGKMEGLSRLRYAEGRWVGDVEGALWRQEWIDRNRRQPPQLYRDGVLGPDLQRVVVAVDPAVTSRPGSDETGIIVAGKGSDGRGYVLADRSCRLPPDDWARRAVVAYREFGADSIVAEVNNGGDLVPLIIHNVDANVPVKSVTASRGKWTRADPVAQKYARGEVTHVETFPELEAQLCSWNPQTGDKSPDRLDALVWGLSELLIASTWGSGEGEAALIA